MSDDRRGGSGFVKFLAFIGVLAIIAGIAYAVYRYFTPEYLEDDESDDDFDDDFDDFFEDEDDVAGINEETVKETLTDDGEAVKAAG